jgi:glycosyltransferase involved in cell wall biosynthesis
MSISVTHVIPNLDVGGAEMMLLRLISAMDPARFRNSVVTLGPEGALARTFRAAGVPVRPLDMALWKLAGELRRCGTQIVQTWMYHADLLGGLASLALGRVPVVWNIRGLNTGITRRRTIWISRACAAASTRLPARIVCCSRAVYDAHAAAGYPRARMRVIPNGFDTNAFRPDATARAWLRRELGISPETPLAGMIARFDSAKDHRGFFEAAAMVHRADPRAHFVLCGTGITRANRALAAMMEAAGVAECCRLLGRRDDMPRIIAGLDLVVSSSVAEGFPNVLGEAMACGVPCVATDAGDSRALVGEAGFIVPVRNPAPLAEKVLEVISMDPGARAALGLVARDRVRRHFSLGAAARQYEAVYGELTAECAA